VAAKHRNQQEELKWGMLRWAEAATLRAALKDLSIGFSSWQSYRQKARSIGGDGLVQSLTEHVTGRRAMGERVFGVIAPGLFAPHDGMVKFRQHASKEMAENRIHQVRSRLPDECFAQWMLDCILPGSQKFHLEGGAETPAAHSEPAKPVVGAAENPPSEPAKPAVDGDADAPKKPVIQSKAIGDDGEAHARSMGEPEKTRQAGQDWFSDEPPVARFQHGPVRGSLKELSDWIGQDRRTLRKNNGQTHWIVQQNYRSYLVWFANQKAYAQVNQYRLASRDTT
jgi:hypothetical protein